MYFKQIKSPNEDGDGENDCDDNEGEELEREREGGGSAKRRVKKYGKSEETKMKMRGQME